MHGPFTVVQVLFRDFLMYFSTASFNRKNVQPPSSLSLHSLWTIQPFAFFVCLFGFTLTQVPQSSQSDNLTRLAIKFDSS